LDGDDVAAGGDQAGRVEVPEVVQSETAEACGCRGGPPAEADVVDLETGGLAEPQAGEGAQDDEERKVSSAA
jgi:hypothetical protein